MRGKGGRVRHEILVLRGRGSPRDSRAGNPVGAGPRPRRGIGGWGEWIQVRSREKVESGTGSRHGRRRGGSIPLTAGIDS